MGAVEKKLEFLYAAIQDTQETIRFTDAKSGTVIVLVLGIITAILSLYEKFIIIHNQNIPNIIIPKFVYPLAAIFIVFLLFALLLSLLSINPSNNVNSHIEQYSDKTDLYFYVCGLEPKMRLSDYIFEREDSKLRLSAKDYYVSIQKAEEDDIVLCLTNELLKLSYIKEKKINKTKSSISCLGLSFLVFFATVFIILIIEHLK